MNDEQYRRECEAREWLKRYPKGGAAWYAKLAKIERIRGRAAADQLRMDVIAEWKRKKGK